MTLHGKFDPHQGYNLGYRRGVADTETRYKILAEVAAKVLEKHGLEPGHQEDSWYACNCEDCSHLRAILAATFEELR